MKISIFLYSFAALALLSTSSYCIPQLAKDLELKEVFTGFRDKNVFKNDKGISLVVEKEMEPEPLYPDELVDRMHTGHKERMQLVSSNPDMPDRYYAFVPQYLGTFMPGEQGSWKGKCFGLNEFSVTVDFHNATSATANLTVVASKHAGIECVDFYLFALASTWHNENIRTSGSHTIIWTAFSQDELDDIRLNGFRVFLFFEDQTNTILDVYETYTLFGSLFSKNDTHVTDEEAAHNLKFLKDYCDIDMAPREIEVVYLDESEIYSGDQFVIMRLDGLGPLEAWGSASNTGHATIALRINGSLQVCESNTKSSFWPVDHVQCNPYDTWLQYAKNADLNVAVLHLSPEKRAIFNEEAAVEWVQSVLGNIYGFQNFLFTFFDVGNNGNLPPPMDSHLFSIAMSVLDPIIGPKLAAAHKPSLWNAGFNMRLGTNFTSTIEIFNEAARRNISFDELMSMPEQDHWIYPGDLPYYPDGQAMVCDVFVSMAYRAGGLFGDLDINLTEFTPIDAYELNFYDTTPIPAKCEAADPGNPFCQILGKYRVVLDQYNTVDPFDHMRERCPTVPRSLRFNITEKLTC